MPHVKRVLAALLLCFAVSGEAATTTITTTAGDDSRIVAACGHVRSLGRDCTGPEVKAWLIEQLRGMVLNDEFEQAKKSIASSPLNPS